MRVPLTDLADDLEKRADWLTGHLRRQEWIDGGEEGWFNSYYDNDGQAGEGFFPAGVRMMLTGQVFAVMGGVADEEQVGPYRAQRRPLPLPPRDRRLPAEHRFRRTEIQPGPDVRLCLRREGERRRLLHMTVMYANALYRRGFAREGWKALKTLADAALHFETSRIYPGIPEYFSTDGRGVYHYLTGAASWFMLTMITQAFGVRGEAGDLLLAPQLTAEQFDETGTAELQLTFAGRPLTVRYHNAARKEAGSYRLGEVRCGDTAVTPGADGTVKLPRALVEQLPAEGGLITAELV